MTLWEKSRIADVGEERKGRPRGFGNNKLTSSDDIFKFVLGYLWDKLVKPAIDVLDIKDSQ